MVINSKVAILRSFPALIVLLLFAVSCASEPAAGTSVSLREETGEVSDQLTMIAREALGEVELIGTRVGPLPCEGSDGWFAIVLVIVGADPDPLEAQARLTRWLTAKAIAFDQDLSPGGFGYRVSFTDDLTGRPILSAVGNGLGLTMSTGCYPDTALGAESAGDLTSATGVEWKLLPNDPSGETQTELGRRFSDLAEDLG